MAQAATYDLTIEAGADFRLSLRWSTASGTPINLTGYTARMQLRIRQAAPAFLLELTTENGGITLGGAAGTIQLHATAAQTAALRAAEAVYDLELVNGSGEVIRWIEGAVEIRPEVTR